MTMTIRDIAELAGVSVSTVSKVMNHKDETINPQTREKVLAIVKEYNYKPYASIRARRSTSTFKLGVCLSSPISSPDYLNGLMECAAERGYQILLLFSNGSAEQENRHISTMISEQVDGVLLQPVSENVSSAASELEDASIPYILLDKYGNNDYVRIDYQFLGYVMTQKLIDFRHRRIACLVKNDGADKDFLDGYRRCLSDNNINYNEDMICPADDASIRDLFINGRPSGIICTHESAMAPLFQQLRILHAEAPYNFSLMTLKSTAHSSPVEDVSGITVPSHRLGSLTCGRLIDICEQQDLSSCQFPELIGDSSEIIDERTISLPVNELDHIVVVGSINSDSIFNVAQAPQAGKTINILNVTEAPGGKGANQSISLARLGKQVLLIGSVGNDRAGTIVLRELTKNQVNCDSIMIDKDASTGKAYIFLEETGESAISLIRGANSGVSTDYIRRCENCFEHAKYCLISTEISIDAALAAAKIAKQYGLTTIVKPSGFTAFPEEFYEYTDILVPNRKEALALQKSTSGNLNVEKAADVLLAKGVKTVIITLDHEGCYLRTQDVSRHYPAAPFEPIDTTGGADAFISALAAYMSSGYDLDHSIRIASYAAGFCISRYGAMSALVDKNTLETHIVQNEPEVLRVEKIVF